MNARDKMTFCTLFDSNYLDKGLALYNSMRRNIEQFRLYIFAFDNKCFEVLSAMKLRNVTLVYVEDIMTDKLRRIKGERTPAEFCWTCSSVIIEYVLQKYNEKMCTYIDADIYFFANPVCVVQEILDHKCSVGLVCHGFERDYEYIKWISESGKYCIQFNTFLNNEEGLRVLREWKENCFDWCYNRLEDGKLGDQKYADKWRLKYDCVYECSNLGAGVAPWNLHLYTYTERQNEIIMFSYRNKQFPLIFYHFEGMKYLPDNRVFLNLWKHSKPGMRKKVKLLYGEYVEELEHIRKYLLQYYNVEFGHMIIDNKMSPLKKYSLKYFCENYGILDGLYLWKSERSNNILKID